VTAGWLLDTNILSELRRPKPERKVIQPARRPNPETMPGLC
jgi:predicted nucleic acid-binding protein